MAKLEVPKTGPPWQRSSNCASRTSTTGRMWQQVDDEIPRLHPRLFTMVRLSEVIMMMVMLQSFSCLVVVPVAAQPSTDPTEAAILRNFTLAYQLQNSVFPGSDPCQTWNSRNIKCDCYFNASTVCRVTRLDFSLTGMAGPFPTQLTQLTALVSLQLFDNNLTGPLPPEIGNLTLLQSLSVGTNLLSGPIPPELANLQNLGLLHMDSNQFSGAIPTALGSIQSLQQLWLQDNNLTGPVPDIFANLTRLLEVRIHGNPLLLGPIPSSLFNNSYIQAIYFGELSPGGALTTSFNTPLPNLTVLYLRNCQLTGSIPSSINLLSGLQYLDLSFNNLSGEIPAELSGITSLKTLYLGNNSLTGPLPDGFGALSSLTDVDVSYNFLSGTLPSWADKLTPIVVSNYFNATTAGNSSVQPQLSLLNCNNQTAPCNRSAPGNMTSVAVRAGGAAYENYQGDTAPLGTTAFFASPSTNWAVSSTGFVQGASFTSLVTSSTPVSGTADPTLYQTARTALGSLHYYATNLQSGVYTVVLSFAEIVYLLDDPLARRYFDIYLQGQLVKKDFNIRQTAGASFIALDQTFRAAVSNGVLDVHLFYAGKGTCCLPEPGNWSFGPLVSAIAIDNVQNAGPGGPSPIPSGAAPTKSNGAPVGVIVGITVAALLLLLLCMCLLCRIAVVRRQNRTTLLLADQLEIQRFQVQPNLFSYAELKAATRSFHPNNKLGEGGYGVVYKGVLPDGTEVAVKTLSAKSYQGKQEFLNEAALITAVQHRSLVKLKGCCLERDHRILVYEYMENKSLHQTLFGVGAPPMDWPTRFNIALGTARGLAYLHEESEHKVVHRDIKASNILLDRNFNPKIADFGMARLFEDHQSHVSTRVAGTLGYVAPEYALLGQLTEKADVFSYGIVLLELVSGRFNIRPDILGEQAYLLEWAWKLMGEGNLLYLMDARLAGSYVEDEVLRVVHVALLCTQAVASTRPAMTRVVAMLVGDVEIPTVTSGPGFMAGLMDSSATASTTPRTATPQTTTSSTTSTTGSDSTPPGRTPESAPLIQLSETRMPDVFTEMGPR